MTSEPSAVANGRHSRQVRFRPVGEAGQARLAGARVLVVGLGATGGAVANTLARAGVGHLTLADRDFPELHNLQRQTLFEEADVASGRPKAVAAADHLRRIDASLDVTACVTDVHAGNVMALVEGRLAPDAAGASRPYDLIMDGTDNFATRFVLNDAALSARIPWIYAGVIGAHGSIMGIEAAGGPCLRCLYPEPPMAGAVDTCDTVGVLHPAVAVVGGLASMEALRCLLGQPMLPGLLHVDLWDGAFQRFQTPANPACLSCQRGEHPALDGAAGGDLVVAQLCGRDAVHLRPGDAPQATSAASARRVDLAAIAARLAPVTRVMLANDFLVRFEVDGRQITLFEDGRAIVQGTDDPQLARSVYSRWIGL